MAFAKGENKSKEATELKISEQEKNLVEWVYSKFKESYIAKQPLMKDWRKYIDVYTNKYFEDISKPEYKSNQISNFVFSTIESIRPVMIDNDPKFIALPRTSEGSEKAELIQLALNSEWDREKMSVKLPKNLLLSLQIGTGIFGCFWDGKANNGIGEIKVPIVNPFNIFPDPLATGFDDAEFVIYATYKNVNLLKKSFPDKASLLEGGNIKYDELVAIRELNTDVNNQVLVLEGWFKDYTMIEYEEEVEGKKVKKFKAKYPRGRVVTCCPEIGVLLSDKHNPYSDGKFPFVMIKTYDMPFQFWGEGEIKWLFSPQKYINELNNQIIDNAKLTANQVWIIDKNAGIGKGKLTNRPGLVIRKNPGTEVRRESPPSMPTYIRDKILELKEDIDTISGVYDVTRGERAIGITAGNAIMALQEAGQARIRIKVKLMEYSLGELATMWYSRMQQFWKLDREVRTKDNFNRINFNKVSPDDLQNDFDIIITAGSTLPSNKPAMLDLMIRLGQTMAEDGLPVVDREAILDCLPIGDKNSIIERLAMIKQEAEAKQQAQVEQQQAMMQQQQEQQSIEQIMPLIEDLQMQVQQLAQAVVQMQQPQQVPQEMMQQALPQEALNPQMESGQVPEQPSGLENIPTEVLEMISQLSNEELQLLLQEYPELQQLLG